ncbi:MAG: RNase P subunit p30 family protein [Promethearchaeota archaeon]
MSYFESRVKCNFNDFYHIERIISQYKELGVKNLILEPINQKRNNISKEIKKKLANLSGANIYYRFTLKINNLNEFRNEIKKYSNKREIIAIESMNKDVQIHAARDSRVDMLTFSDINSLKTLTPGLLSLIKQHNSFIEYCLAPIMVQNRALQSKNFRNLYKFLNLGINSKINYIISGGFNHKEEFRHPRALLSICHTLLGLSIREAKNAFSINPKRLIENALQRSSKNDNGIKIIRG